MMMELPFPEGISDFERENARRRLASQGFDARTFSGTARVFRCLYREQTSRGFTYSQFLSPNMKGVPLSRAVVAVRSPSLILSDEEFTVESDIGPAVLISRRVDITTAPDYLKRTVNLRKRVKGPLPDGPGPELPGPFSEWAQRTKIWPYPSPRTSVYGVRAVWLESPPLAVEEFYVLLASDMDQATHAAAEFAMQRSDLPWKQLSVEIEETHMSRVSCVAPALVLNKGSKLDWEEYIAQQLLPGPIGSVSEADIYEHATPSQS